MPAFTVRYWRYRAHQCFDQMWSGSRAIMTRRNAYRWLQRVMRLSPEQAHIGRFDTNRCRKLIEECGRLGYTPPQHNIRRRDPDPHADRAPRRRRRRRS